VANSEQGSGSETVRKRSVLTGGGILLALILVIVAAFSNVTRSGFVYDDRHEILDNPFVQQSSLLVQGLTSDAWAFKGPGQVWSNYWRPARGLWTFANWQLFRDDPVGWHLLNLGIHLLVALIAFRFLLRLRFTMPVAALAVLIFAIHPTKSESVTWLAGSTDILGTLFVLLSLHRLLSWLEKGKKKDLRMSVVLFFLALSFKEVMLATILLIPVVASMAPASDAAKNKGLVRLTLPFLVAGVVFLVFRYQVLGFLSRPFPDSPTWSQTLLTAPRILVFYVRQCVWPTDLSVVHDLKPVSAGDLASTGYWVEVVLAALILGLAVWLYRKSPALRFGVALFFIPLLPAFALHAFKGGDLVHERYLYLPLLGFGLLVSLGISGLAGRLSASNERGRTLILISSAAAAAAGLGFLLFSNNGAWESDVTLWEHASKVEPMSVRVWTELGSAYQQAGRASDAEQSIERSLALGPTPENTLVIYGMAAKDRGQLAVAKERLERAVAEHPEYSVGWDQLGVVYDMLGDADGCVATYRRASKSVPYRSALYSVNIAVELAKVGRKKEAAAELEPIREQLAASRQPELARGLFYLGMLRLDLGDHVGAVAVLKEFSGIADSFNDPKTLQFAEEARQQLQALEHAPYSK
jgi:Flp pilus assembly protein TadD